LPDRIWMEGALPTGSCWNREACLRALRLRVDVAVHLACPLEEAPEITALGPQEFPEFEEADLRHLDAGVGLDAPEEIGAAPGSNTVASGGVPEKTEHGAHLG